MPAVKRLLSALFALVLMSAAASAAFADASYRSVEIGGMTYLIEDPSRFYAPKVVAAQAESLYKALEDHPEVKTYVYLVNSSRTVDVLGDVAAEPKLYGQICSSCSASTTDYLRIGSLEEYGQYFYTTDHHWNYRGSYAGYCQVVRMLLGEDEPVIEPAETVTFPVYFNGSLNKNIHRTDSREEFTVYRFDYPEMKIEIDGKPRDRYGNQEAYFSGRYSSGSHMNHYNNFYGGEVGVLHVETEKTDRGNLIVFSNSMSDALNLLLASHFHHTWIVDTRHYRGGSGSFPLSSTVEKQGIGQVLILGDGLYFKQGERYQ